MNQGFGEEVGVVEGFGAVEAEPEGAGSFGESDVDVVENFDVIAEEADGLEDDGGVALVADGGQGVLDGGTDPWSAGDTLALEGEEPGFEFGELARGGFEDEGRCALGLDRVGVRCSLHRSSGAGAGDAGLSGHDGPAGDGVRGEEDGDVFPRLRSEMWGTRFRGTRLEG